MNKARKRVVVLDEETVDLIKKHNLTKSDVKEAITRFLVKHKKEPKSKSA